MERLGIRSITKVLWADLIKSDRTGASKICIEKFFNGLRQKGIFEKYEIINTIKTDDSATHEMISKVIRTGNYSKYMLWGDVKTVKFESIIYDSDFAQQVLKLQVGVFRPNSNDMFNNTYYLVPRTKVIAGVFVDSNVTEEGMSKIVNFLNTFIDKKAESDEKMVNQYLEPNELYSHFEFKEEKIIESLKSEQINTEQKLVISEKRNVVLEKEVEKLTSNPTSENSIRKEDTAGNTSEVLPDKFKEIKAALAKAKTELTKDDEEEEELLDKVDLILDNIGIKRFNKLQFVQQMESAQLEDKDYIVDLMGELDIYFN